MNKIVQYVNNVSMTCHVVLGEEVEKFNAKLDKR